MATRNYCWENVDSATVPWAPHLLGRQCWENEDLECWGGGLGRENEHLECWGGLVRKMRIWNVGEAG